ncbi:MAG: hypothetical protein LQ338_008367 [Usnochroma carphineum]|nr:MAG: hypothetical protein LQ338_008367 [Usnochroma carphineum]
MPGECCSHPPNLIPVRVDFDNLQVGDVSVVWQRRQHQPNTGESIGNCLGSILESRATPGSWSYYSLVSLIGFGNEPCGASYIRLPPRLPPDEMEVDWLGVEGMKALVWGGGRWFSGAKSKRGVLGGRQTVSSYDKTVQWPGPQISKNRAFYMGGSFTATSPPRARFPNLTTVNGTQYHADGTDGTDGAGNTLDLNDLAG